MKILGIIPARYASTRFPGKPLVDIKGKSMIQRVYEQSCKASLLSDVVVATDDERIEAAVKRFGGKVVMTSSSHRSGTDRCYQVVNEHDNQYDAVVNIQGDEPFINPSQIDLVAEIISGNADIASLCKPIVDIRELISENAVKVVFDNDGNALYFSRYAIPFLRNGGDMDTWLAKRTFYKHIGIYAYKTEVLKTIAALPQSGLEMAESLEQLRWLENGFKIRMGITEFESYSIDVPDDVQNVLKYF